MTFKHPIDNIRWISVDLLDANDYNPNVVLTPELKLIKFSLMKQGWIQPVLVAEKGERFTIIDGFHRSYLTRTDPELRAWSQGLVPAAVLDISEADRKLLTVRINRAKGSHVAAKMHELVLSLVNEHGIPVETVAQEIGATKHEIDTLMLDSVFEKYGSATHVYSKAWEPDPDKAPKGRGK